jgi:hypothetical protein
MFSTFKYSGLPKGDPPGAPVSVGVSRSSPGGVTITWGPPGSNGNRPITGYGAYITNQNGGFTAASTITGPNTFSVTFGTDNHGSYNGYVYTINMIGNSSVAGGGNACAYYGYNFSTGNCDGYTKYDLNTNGSCGFYRQDTEYNSSYCGYVANPCAGCPAYNSYQISSSCGGCSGNPGCDGEFYYPDGCCGSYLYCYSDYCCGSF